MPGDESPTRRLARWAARLRAEDVPGEALAKAAECLTDWVGVTLAGSTQRLSRAVASAVFDHGKPGTGRSTLLRTGLDRTSCLWAAFLNGFSGHILELDDVHETGVIHPAAVVIPSALALAEELGVTGEGLLLAIVIGYEIAIRVAQAAGASHYRNWHATGTCGTFGAACAAGKVLGLNEARMAWSLGNAGTQAAGLWQFLEDGAPSKPLHAAKAAFNGLLAAVMAAKGFRGPHRILEGRKAFLPVTSPHYRIEALTSGLGERYQMMGVSFKPYPSCRHSHPQIDAALEISRRPEFRPEDVSAVRVRTYPVAIDVAGGRGVYPSSPSEARFSSPYCIAVALSKRGVELRDFGVGAIRRNQYARDVVARTVLEVGREFEIRYPEAWGAAVEVEMQQGGVLSASVSCPKGSPGNPLSREELCRKAVTNAQGALGRKAASALIPRLSQIRAVGDAATLFGA